MMLSNFSQIQGLFQTFSRNTKQSQKSCKFKNFPELLFRMCSLGQKLTLKNWKRKKKFKEKSKDYFGTLRHLQGWYAEGKAYLVKQTI